jgi:hypothetical protein
VPPPAVACLTWSTAHVCHALGITAATFMRQRAVLAAAGFPGKLPGLNAFSAAAVTHWINSGGLTYAPLAGTIPDGDPEIEAIVSALERDYGGNSVAREVA